MVTVFQDVFGHRLHLDPEQQRHILNEHPEVEPFLARLGDVFSHPEFVKRSRRNTQVHLYYRFYGDILGGKYLLAVAAIGHPSVVLTCYVTDIIKQGELLWPKS